MTGENNDNMTGEGKVKTGENNDNRTAEDNDKTGEDNDKPRKLSSGDR